MGAVAEVETFRAVAARVREGKSADADRHRLERGYRLIGRGFAVEGRNYVVFAGQGQKNSQAISLPGDFPGPRCFNFLRIARTGSHAKASAQGKLLYCRSGREPEAVRSPVHLAGRRPA